MVCLSILLLNILTFRLETPNAVVTNSASYSFYLSFMYGIYIKSYKKYEALKQVAKSSSWLNTL